MANRWSKDEVRRSRERKSCWHFAALLLGLCFAQGIFYVGKVGNLYVDILYPVALAILLLRAAFYPAETERNIIDCFDRGILPFLIVIVLSFVLVVITTSTHTGLQINPYVNGLVVLGASVVAYLAVLSLKSFVEYILKGLWVGLLVSVAVSIAQYIAFQNGGAFTFYGLFPQPAFYISIPWGASSLWASNVEYLVYSYRAQGLYLECSYFVAAATMIYVLMSGSRERNSVIRVLVLFVLLVLFAMSATGNIALFIFFVVLVYILRHVAGIRDVGVFRKRRRPLELFTIIFIVFLAAAFVVYAFLGDKGLNVFVDVDTISEGLAKGFESTDIAGGDNEGRYLCMSNAVAEFLSSPWGVGYNMAPSVLEADYGTNTTFSYFLTLLVELGIPGLVAYGYFVIRIIVNLLGCCSCQKAYRIGLAVGIMALAGFQIGNGSGLIPMAWCLFALAAIETSRNRERSGNHEIDVKY